MKQRWIRKSRTSNTSHQRPACVTPARQPPSTWTPALVPSQAKVSVPVMIQLNDA
jgi:hypothetical protein